MSPTKPYPPQLMTASPSAPQQIPSGTRQAGNRAARPWRCGTPPLNEGDVTSWKERESNGKSRMSLFPPHGPGQEGKEAGAQGWAGPGTTSKSLSSHLSTRRTVKNWPHFGQFPQLRPCLAPISVNSLSSNRKNRRWAGGVLDQRGHRNLARVALVVQPLLA